MNKLRNITIGDLLGSIKFILILLPSLIFKLYLKIIKKEIWLICETKDTARDNGISFYKYLCEEHKEINAFYAINKQSYDYQNIKKYNNIIKWGSFKHYLYYMSSKWNISSHKEGNPNQTLFTLLHLYFNLYNNRIFLQHGVLYQNYEMFHQKNTKFKMFVTGAKPEYDFVKEKFGYKNEVKYTGLARFDNLYKNKNNNIKEIILYMPTWRRWFKSKEELINSTYYKKINSFINSEELESLLTKYDKKLLFCPHVGLSKYNNLYKTKNKHVDVLETKKESIQNLLIKGTVLITDFSSLHTDFAFMKKSILYYQYDELEFKERHIGRRANNTYYAYKKDGFGPVVKNEKDALNELEKILKNDCKLEIEYSKRIENFFELHDDKNCERIYEEIMKLDGK